MFNTKIRRYVLLGGLAAVGVAILGSSPRFVDGRNHLSLYVDTTLIWTDIVDLNAPQPGNRLIFARDVYRAEGMGTDATPVGDVIGRNHLVCTVASSPELSCIGDVYLDGRGSITLAGPFVLGDPAFNPTSEAAVTGGTGEFAGVEGVLVATEVNPVEVDVHYLFVLRG